MALHSLKPLLARALALLLLTTLLTAAPAVACFGPKLYIGSGEGPEQDFLYALVALYIKEKTGVESVRVPLAGNDPVTEVTAARVDLAFAPADEIRGTPVLAPAGFPRLLAGNRVRDDLQFTTVLPALRKLAGLLSPADLAAALTTVNQGGAPAATARLFLSSRGWL